MNNLDVTKPNYYKYRTEYLEIHIYGGIKTIQLTTLRITLSIQKRKSHNILRHWIYLYYENQTERLVWKAAERLKIENTIVRRTLQELTRELENYRYLLLVQ